MKCYYEILEIPRIAEDDEIKSAYRKLALKWHPDKNIDNTEDAKEQFQLIKQAYEVLSDRQERAWYDKHREEILRESNLDFKDDILDVFPYFTTQCFRGYGDDDKGFYSVYRTVFEKIAKEDIEYMDTKSDFDEIPSFGKSTSNYEEIVGPFYDYWSSYNTRKSYAWLDPISINETRNSRLLKIIEKQNKKVRQKAKKERNEEIRNLVAFVRKRDKRVKVHVQYLEEKVIENRQKQEQIRKQKILENKKELINNSKSQAEWSKFDNVKHELKEIEKSLAEQFGENISDSEANTSEEDNKKMTNNLYCVACNKVFKTPKAFANHESSKKHRENIEILKHSMLEEDNKLDEIENNFLINDDVENGYHLEDINEEKSDLEMNETKKKNKKSKKVIRLQKLSVTEDCEHSEFEPAEGQITISDDDFNFGSTEKQKKKNNTQSKTLSMVQENKSPNIQNEKTENDEKQSTNNEQPVKKQKKKTQKKITTIIGSSVSQMDMTLCCAICKMNFPSKNKLFEHLKKTGHSVALADTITKNKKCK